MANAAILLADGGPDPLSTLAGLPLALRAVLTLQRRGVERVVFVGSPGVAEAVRRDPRAAIALEVTASIEDARQLAGESAAVVRHDVVEGESVATEAGRRRAVDALFEHCRKPVDGVVSRYLNRHVSIAISKRLVETAITPNQVSIAAMVIGLAGAACAARGGYGWPLLGATLLQIDSIVDGVDGELARVRFQQSRLGEWLDNVSDDLTSLAFWLGMTIGSIGLHPWLTIAGWIAVGSYAVFVALMYGEFLRRGSASYFDVKWYDETEAGWRARAMDILLLIPRRDFFVFFCFCAAVGGWLFDALPIVAAVCVLTMAAAAVRTVRAIGVLG